jgi:predicted cupin superfamily sugar epimerase
MKPAQYWIEWLNLERHPEGGYYRETYRSDEIIKHAGLPDRFPGPRVFSTSIYFLLPGTEISQLHRIKSDELWHFHIGGTLVIHMIEPGGRLRSIKLGQDLEGGERLQAAVPAGCWFGAKLEDPDSFCLVGCTVAPGFDFEDFQLADRSELLQTYPQHRKIIELLTETNRV